MSEKKNMDEALASEVEKSAYPDELRRRSSARQPRALGRLRRLADALRDRGDREAGSE